MMLQTLRLHSLVMNRRPSFISDDKTARPHSLVMNEDTSGYECLLYSVVVYEWETLINYL